MVNITHKNMINDDRIDLPSPSPLDADCVVQSSLVNDLTISTPKIAAVIPARGGSKGLPHKNITLLHGRPLIQYTIEVAQRCTGITRVIVSTEDPAIAALAISLGAEVPFLRPKHLAGDKAVLGEAIDFTVRELARRGNPIDGHMVMLPTSPFRPLSMIETLASKLIQGHATVCTAKPVEHRLFARREGALLKNILTPEKENEAELRQYFKTIGLVTGTRHTPSRRQYCHVVEDPASLVDIDTPEDMMLAEMIMEKGLFDFGFTFPEKQKRVS